jgi:hypothetical protein
MDKVWHSKDRPDLGGLKIKHLSNYPRKQGYHCRLRAIQNRVKLEDATWHWHPTGGPANRSTTEFLTQWTTFTNEMSKRTTFEKNCQKRLPLSGGTPGQATRGMCRLGRSRQGGAAIVIVGKSPGR